MTWLPALTAGEVLRVLQRAGFVIEHSSGSHHRLAHTDDPSRATTVAVHAGKTLQRGALHGIIKQAGATIEEFRALLWRQHRYIFLWIVVTNGTPCPDLAC
jgi:predicted RNA binding protein YcfA (HicA-like mRNA interferase family)